MQKSRVPAGNSGTTAELIGAWLFVGIPFAWGVYVTVGNATALFK